MCLEEYIRKKRKEDTKEGGEREGFKKSKLTLRSPQKEIKVEEKIDDLIKIIVEMEGKLGDKLEAFKDEFKEWKAE